MSGAFKTVATDELVTKSSKKNKVTGGAQAAVEQNAPKQDLTAKNKVTTLAQADAASGKGTALTVPTVTYGSQTEDYSSYLEQMYAAKKQAAMAALKKAYDNSVAELDRAESGLAEGYQASRNEAAGAHEMARRNFAEFAAANGLNNGTAGQAELSRSVTLQNNMNDIRTAEASAMADLTLQRAEAENEYNAAIAQAEYTGEYELAAALYEEKVRVQEALIDAEIRRQQYALEQYQLQYQAQRDAVADRRYESEQALALRKYQDSLALEQAAQALKEKDQADELALAQAEQALKEQQARADQALAQQKYSDSLAQALKEQLAEYGELYLKAGIMPSESMREAMGITAADAHKYILAMKSSKK